MSKFGNIFGAIDIVLDFLPDTQKSKKINNWYKQVFILSRCSKDLNSLVSLKLMKYATYRICIDIYVHEKNIEYIIILNCDIITHQIEK